MHLGEIVYYVRDGSVHTCRLLACKFKRDAMKAVVKFYLDCKESILGWTSISEAEWLAGRSGIIWTRTPQD